MLQLGISWRKAVGLAMKSLLPARALTRLSIVGRQGFCAHDTLTQHPCTIALHAAALHAETVCQSAREAVLCKAHSGAAAASCIKRWSTGV